MRNAQLDKEAAELRRESVELSHAAQEARNGVANSQEASLSLDCTGRTQLVVLLQSGLRKGCWVF